MDENLKMQNKNFINEQAKALILLSLGFQPLSPLHMHTNQV